MLPRFIAAVVLISPPAWGKDLSPSEAEALGQRFTEVQKSTQTLQAGFEQSISFPGMRIPAVSRGVFFYRAPGDLRIDYAEPRGEYFLLRGDTFELSRGERRPVKRPATDRSARALVALREILRGAPDNAGVKMERRVSLVNDEYVVTITPANPAPGLPEEIENRIDRDSLLLRSMTVRLPRGATMQFVFSQPRRNAELAAELFDAP